MAYGEYLGGLKNLVLKTGRIMYGGDGTNFYPLRVAGSSGEQKLAQREPFEFRPGQTTLVDGAVAAGSRTGSGTVTTAASAAVTYWGSWIQYAPARSGKIDGLSAGGIVEGQLTIGHKSAAGTVNVKVSAEIANTANTASADVLVTLTANTSVTTAETYSTFDINYLKTDSVFNAVPFSLRVGIQTATAASAGIARFMESSALRGEFEPGT